MKRLILSLLLVGLFAQVGLSQITDEQRDRRRAFLEGLLRTVVESQIPQPTDPNTPPVITQPPTHLQPPTHVTPGNRPTHPGHGHTHRPPAVSPQMASTARAVHMFSESLDGLIAALQNEERYSPAIRPLLGDAVRIKSSAKILDINAQRVTDPAMLQEGFRIIDQYWRLLSHRLGHMRNLSAACRTEIQKVTVVEQQLCKLLDIEPQLDRNTLISQMIALRTNLSNLLHDVAIDVRDSKLRSRILIDGRGVLSQIDRAISAVGQRSKNTDVIKAYSLSYDKWSELSIHLRGAGSVSVARNIQQIDKLNTQIHELLWLEMPINRAAIAHYAKAAKHEYECLCNDLSLAMILSFPDAPKLTSAMGAFRGIVDDFAAAVASDASADDLRWDYRLLDVEWHQIEARLVKIDVKAIGEHAASICGTLDALRETLQIRPEFDREMAAALASAVDQLAAQYDMQIRGLVYRPGMYPHQEAAKIAGASHAFHEAAHQLHQCIVRGEAVPDLRSDCIALGDAWQKMAVAVGKLNRQDAARLMQLTEQIVLQIAKLQILLAY